MYTYRSVALADLDIPWSTCIHCCWSTERGSVMVQDKHQTKYVHHTQFSLACSRCPRPCVKWHDSLSCLKNPRWPDAQNNHKAIDHLQNIPFMLKPPLTERYKVRPQKLNRVIAGFALSISISYRLAPSSAKCFDRPIAFVCLCKALLTACI